MARWKTSVVVRIGFPSLKSGQRVGPEPEPEGFQPDDALRGDVAEVDVRSDEGDEVGLQGRRGCLEEQVLRADAGGQHVLDQPGPRFAVRPADARPPALPGLQRDQRRAGLEVLADVLDPRFRRQLRGTLRVLEAHLGYHGEVSGELSYVTR